MDEAAVAVTPAAAVRMAPLALLEAVDRDGHVRQAWRVERWPFTIGRALDNDAVLTDPHVAAHHASIVAMSSGAVADTTGPGAAKTTLLVSAGDTKNGLAVGAERIAGGITRELADFDRDLELRLGRTTLRLRLPGHALAPEQAMSNAASRDMRWPVTAALVVGVLALVLGNTWIDSDPETFPRAVGNALLGALSVGALWCGLWALLSKTFTRQGHFGWHLRVFAIASLATLALAVLPPLIAFAMSWPWVTDFSFIPLYATAATAFYFHLLAVEPGRPRLMRAIVLSGFAAGVAVSLWFNVQRTGRPGEELYMNHLFAPQLRAARPVPVDRFVESLAPMQAILDRKAREQAGADGDSRSGNDDEE